MTQPIFNPDAPTALTEVSHRLMDQLEAFDSPERYASPVWISNERATEILLSTIHAERFDPAPPDPHDEVLARIGICPCLGCKASADKWKGTA